MAITNVQRDQINKMNRASQKVLLGTIIQGLQTNTAPMAVAATSGTILSKMLVTPGASAAVSGIDYHKLFGIGDVTGTTAYGFGDPTKPTTGLMASFGRTTVATAGITDTSLDIRAINKVVNTGANTIQGAYIKAKNYTGGTVGTIKGLFVEIVNEGTATLAIGIDIGTDGTVPNADIRFSNGGYLVALTTAITATSTDTTAPAGSIGFTTHAIGVGKLFVSDGSKWQYMAVAG